MGHVSRRRIACIVMRILLAQARREIRLRLLHSRLVALTRLLLLQPKLLLVLVL